MEKIRLDIREESKQIRRIFNERDTVTVEELLAKIEELDDEVSRLQDEYNELEENMRENYKPRSEYELYGINERDFH